ncbi:MAG TPA: Crp/Fnr family transcriptional regulator [Hyphomonadaceae bacterium]|nr:Crp/Fnr family transcriptional regulator [Hyphomonadaceae bacterium]
MCISGGHIIDLERSGAASWVSADKARGARSVPAHQHLFFEGDDRTHIFVIESGWVKLYRTLIDGQRQVVGFCNGGSILGLEGAESHVNACEAVTSVRVRAIPLSRLADVCTRDPELAGQLLQQMGRQLGSAQAQLTTVGAQSADQKLATFLLAFADYGAPDGGEFDLPMRRSDIGEFLGLRLETVSRKLSDFQRRKWVRMVSLYRCQILNREALECLAEGGEVEDLGQLAH